MANEVEIVVTGEDRSKAAVASSKKGIDEIGASAAAATPKVERTEAATDDLGQSVRRVGEIAAGVLLADFFQQAGAAAQRMISSTITAANDLGESINAVNKIFEDASEKIHDFGETTAEEVGLSTRAFNQMAVPLGALLRNVGFTTDQVADHTINLTKRASDMASVFNKDVTVALEAIQAGLRGESDPLEQFGVGLNEASVQAQALADTGKTATSELTRQEMAAARLALIFKQTNSAAGDFADTSDGLANSQRIATAQIEDAKAKIGEDLLPVLASAAQAGGKFAEVIGGLPAPLLTFGAVIAAVVGGFVILAPKVMEARDAFTQLRSGIGGAESRAATFAKGLGAVTVALTAVQIASAAMGKSAGEGTRTTQKALDDLTASGKATSEVTKHLASDFQALGSGAMDSFGNSIAGVIEGVTGLGGVMTESLQHAQERIASIDAALADHVRNGNAELAAEQFEMLRQMAADAGISVDDLKRGLPQYAEAQLEAGEATVVTASAIKDEKTALKDLGDELRKQTDPIFALMDAQRDLTESQAVYTEAVKKHGVNSVEAREALRKLTEAAIDMSGAAGAASGTLDGSMSPALRAALRAANLTEDQIRRVEKSFLDAKAAGDKFSGTYNAVAQITYIVKGAGAFGEHSGRSGGRAHGGVTGAESGASPYGGMTMVGERGPELVRLPFGSTVSPHGASMAAMNGGGGWGGPVQVVVSLDPSLSGPARDIGAALVSMLRFEARPYDGSIDGLIRAGVTP